MVEEKPSAKKQPKRIPVSDSLWAYLELLSKTRLYGKGVTATACFILRREIDELITSGKLDALLARAKALNLGDDDDQDDEANS